VTLWHALHAPLAETSIDSEKQNQVWLSAENKTLLLYCAAPYYKVVLATITPILRNHRSKPLVLSQSLRCNHMVCKLTWDSNDPNVLIEKHSSSSRMCVIYHNWSATKQRPHPQSVAEISRHSVLSGDRIRQCETSSGSRHKDTDQCL